MVRADYSESGFRWEYISAAGKHITNRSQKWPAPPCDAPTRPSNKKTDTGDR